MGVGTWGGVGEPGRGVERSYGISCVFVFGDGVGLVVVYDGVCGVVSEREMGSGWGGCCFGIVDGVGVMGKVRVGMACGGWGIGCCD